MTFFRFIAFLALFSGLISVAHAQGTQVAFGAGKQDTSLPVEVTAENLNIDNASGTAVFSNDVLIVQGEMRLAAGKVLVVYRQAGKGIARLEASDGVTLVSGTDAAEAERADYDIDNGSIVMSGNVLLTQGPSAIAADRMTVRLDDGTAQMSGRVKTILQTGDD